MIREGRDPDPAGLAGPFTGQPAQFHVEIPARRPYPTADQGFWRKVLSNNGLMPVDYSSGGLAQLGERDNGIVEVRGSIPLSSTISRLLAENGRAVEQVRGCAAPNPLNQHAQYQSASVTLRSHHPTPAGGTHSSR